MSTDQMLKTIIEKLDSLQKQIADISYYEIINRDELCKRLLISDETYKNWVREGKIPLIRMGNNAVYDWVAVNKALMMQKITKSPIVNIISKEDLLNRKLWDLDLSFRCRNALSRHISYKPGQTNAWDDITVNDVLKLNSDELKSIRNFGVQSINELKNTFKELGFDLFPSDNISVNKTNKEELLSQPVYELNLSTRSYKRLCQFIHDKKGIGGVFYDDYIFVKDVIELNLDELNIKGLGIKSINEIKMKLHEYLG